MGGGIGPSGLVEMCERWPGHLSCKKKLYTYVIMLKILNTRYNTIDDE